MSAAAAMRARRQMGALSNPRLSAAFNLREYSQKRRNLAQAQPRCNSVPKIVLDEADLVGGNGKWRKQRAKEEFQRRQVEEKERRREQHIRDLEKQRLREEREQRRRRNQEEAEKRWQEDVQRRRREQEEAEERQRQQEAARRAKQEADRAEWLAKQPKICETCAGTGKCGSCDGKGHLFAMFLAPAVDRLGDASGCDYGRLMQGCESCGGCAQNVMGELVAGSGKCTTCEGTGWVKPRTRVRLQKGFTTRSGTGFPTTPDYSRRGSESPLSPTSTSFGLPTSPTAE